MPIDPLSFPSDSYALKARWILPIEGAPIAGGVVSVEAGTIAAIGTDDPSRQLVDLGNVAILPGLVNAHAHLEFSDLQRPLGRAGTTFPEWIREVVDFRRQRSESTEHLTRLKRDVVRQGANECLAGGTTTLGEITTTPVPEGVLPDAPLQCTMFHELIGLSEERADTALADLTTWLDAIDRQNLTGRPGLSPHAPYSVSCGLLEKAISLSAEKKIPLEMHLAESAEELELLASHSGPFVELFTEYGFWEPAAVPRGVRSLDFLKQLARAHRALVIHGNLLASDEISFLGDHADQMSVVYCPRTHAYFDHGRYPLVEMLDRGVTVALGTDSRASNPNLSLWEEMQFVARAFPELPREQVLKLGTLAGATALGLGREVGSLSPGKQADFCVIGLSDRDAEPHELILSEDSVVEATVCQGSLVATAL